MTEPPLNPKPNRAKAAQIMFEAFNVPAYYSAIGGVLALYAAGRTVGIVVDSGFSVTHTIPIYEGSAIPHAIQWIDLAGQDLTDLLRKKLTELKKDISTCSFSILTEIKEKLCRVEHGAKSTIPALDSPDENCYFSHLPAELLGRVSNLYLRNASQPYELPDGNVIRLGPERFEVTEPVWNPELVGMESCGLDQMTFNSIMQCDRDVRSEMYKNIILAGGNTLFPGFQERFQKQMLIWSHSACMVKVIAPPERLTSAWIGGSIMASLSTFQNIAIGKATYDEYGPSVVEDFCW
jgi:actin-related protein